MLSECSCFCLQAECNGPQLYFSVDLKINLKVLLTNFKIKKHIISYPFCAFLKVQLMDLLSETCWCSVMLCNEEMQVNQQGQGGRKQEVTLCSTSPVYEAGLFLFL